MEILSTLSDSALLVLASREDLTTPMQVVISAEIKKRVEKMERESRIEALHQYWADSVSESVLNDYRAGNVRTILAG